MFTSSSHRSHKFSLLLRAGVLLCALPVVNAAAQTLDGDIQNLVAGVDVSRVGANIQTLANFGTRNTCSSTSSATSGIGAARDWIQSQFAAIAGLQVRIDPFTVTCSGARRTRHNVVAWLPGAGNANRLIVIGGHYDSRTTSVSNATAPAPGANDSGSQTALVLETARVMAGRSYDATLVFVAFAGEEQGLLGSASFAANFRRYFPNGTLELNLNNDIVGGDNTANDAAALQQFRLYSPGTPREVNQLNDGTTDDTSPSRGVMRHIGYWAGSYVPSMAIIAKLREDRVGRGGDHKSFIARSIPGVRFIEPNENLAHQHSPDDLFAFVTPGYTARVTQVVAASAASLARAATPPRSMTASLLSASDVRVAWTAPASGPAVDHYVVAARATGENFYRSRVLVPASALAATVRIVEDLGLAASDAFYVSVAAVDAQGHESLFAYPEYRCTAAGCVVPAGSLDVTVSN
jgi:hypothetical protein